MSSAVDGIRFNDILQQGGAAYVKSLSFRTAVTISCTLRLQKVFVLHFIYEVTKGLHPAAESQILGSRRRLPLKRRGGNKHHKREAAVTHVLARYRRYINVIVTEFAIVLDMMI